jgi:hypothetical protein
VRVGRKRKRGSEEKSEGEREIKRERRAVDK